MQLLSKINSFIRMDEWLTSKVTMMVGILMYLLFLSDAPVGEILPKVSIYFLFTAAFLGISYIVNDLSDIEADRKAGKKKIIAAMPRRAVFAVIALMLTAGNVFCVLTAENKVLCLILTAVIYFWGAAYSMPGIRFKERGIWGLIECSVAQRCLPLLMIPCLVRLTGMQAVLLAVWFVISFLDGLRYILIHQLLDLENDLKSGISTYVASKSRDYSATIRLIFGAELCLVIAVMVPAVLKAPLICALFLAAYCYLEFCIYKVLNVYAKKNWLLTFDSVPLEAFLNMVMPFMIGICMIAVSPWMAGYCLVMLLVCCKPMLVKLKIAKVYLDSLKR